MEILAGMVLLCNMFTSFEYSSFKAKVTDVETKVHFITPRGDAFIEYNLKKHKTFVYTGDEPLYDIVSKVDLERKDYMACRSIR